MKCETIRVVSFDLNIISIEFRGFFEKTFRIKYGGALLSDGKRLLRFCRSFFRILLQFVLSHRRKILWSMHANNLCKIILRSGDRMDVIIFNQKFCHTGGKKCRQSRSEIYVFDAKMQKRKKNAYGFLLIP